MAGHTKEPWTVYAGLAGWIVQRGSSGGFVVEDANEERALADAILIAAAPDLLEALKEADRALKYYEWYSNPKSGWALPDNSSLRGMVDAAIAKAEGRA